MAILKPQETKKQKEKSSLVGTAFGVGLVGAVILVTYLIIYGLYMARV
ncbi:hypothetical protein [Bacillus alkalicellulosilyticus]|nr:hypothetical protein [Bacillus alkalicellulosilyticus]